MKSALNFIDSTVRLFLVVTSCGVWSSVIKLDTRADMAPLRLRRKWLNLACLAEIEARSSSSNYSSIITV